MKSVPARYIIGIGNYNRRDDGVGLHALDLLMERYPVPREFQLVKNQGDQVEMLRYLDAPAEKVVVLDAVLMQEPAGTIKVLDPLNLISNKQLSNLNAHETDFIQTVRNAEAMGFTLPMIRIIAIEPEDMSFGFELSERVADKIEEMIETAVAQITG